MPTARSGHSRARPSSAPMRSEDAASAPQPERRRHGTIGAGCGRSERAARTSARGVRAPHSTASSVSESVMPTAVSAVGHTIAIEATAPWSSGVAGRERHGDEQRRADRRPGRRPGSGIAEPEPSAAHAATHDGGRHGQAEGEQEARRRAEPQRAREDLPRQDLARAAPGRAQHGETAPDLARQAPHAPRCGGRARRWRAARRPRRRAGRGRARGASPRPANGHDHEHGAEGALERRLGREGPGEGRPRRRPASSRLASVARTASPPRAVSRPLRPAPQTYHAHTRRRVTSGHDAASTPRHATPRETCPQTWRTTASTSHPTWAPAGANTAGTIVGLGWARRGLRPAGNLVGHPGRRARRGGGARGRRGAGAVLHADRPGRLRRRSAGAGDGPRDAARRRSPAPGPSTSPSTGRGALPAASTAGRPRALRCAARRSVHAATA